MIKALGVCGCALAILLLGSPATRADTTNFTGDFRAAFWTTTPPPPPPPSFGSVYFTNSNTELVLAGPNQPASRTSSTDPITYNGPLGGGLTVGGTVQFDYEYNSGDALGASEADFAYTPPGGGSSIQNLLGQGGPGVIQSGSFTTPLLSAGTTFKFLLITDTPANKLSGSLVITHFVFLSEIPEPSTAALLAGLLGCLSLARWCRSRRPV